MTTFSSNLQSPVLNVMEKLLNKCQLIIVSIFGNVLIAKINLNAKREIAVFIVLMAVLSALRYKKENAVN